MSRGGKKIWLGITGKLLSLCLLALFPPVSWAERLHIQLLLSDQSTPYREFAIALNRVLIQEKADVLVSESVAVGAPDLVIAVGIKATESAVANSTAPVLGVMVPMAGYGSLLERMAGQHRPNPISAIYVEQPWGRQLDFIQAALPERRRLGLLHSSSTHLDIHVLQPEAVWRGLALKTVQTSGMETLFDDLNRVLDASNVLLATPDSQVYNSNNIRNILLSSYRHKVPLIGLSQAYVNAGALCAIFATPEQIAQQAGELVLAFMKVRRLPPPQYPASFTISLNPQVARSLGIILDSPETIRERMRQGRGE